MTATTGEPTAPKMLSITTVLVAVTYVLFFAPTYYELDTTVWNVVGQGHGPIMLLLAVWLAYQRIERYSAITPGKEQPALGLLVFFLGVILKISADFLEVISIEVGSQILILSGVILLFKGWQGVKVMAAPLLFLIFVVPLPGTLIDALTAPLKLAVSVVSSEILYQAGYPVGRAGVTLTVGPYKLLVADACAGINSVFALEAVGVFYLSLMQYKNKFRNLALAIAILPISFVSNVTRVMALTLITYYYGDEVGQGFVHSFAGVFLFVIATVLTIAVDYALGKVPTLKGRKEC
ncbi:exosortase B [Aquabacterium lacunae]|uniref:Exosortase B n=1 Tax=Aquabacterium lacunae TaxID=2528630 RepID=A0A4Q9GW07_9BURK|nr:exosortase B [Aquabacterium lacunae]TBO28319.1 exosortase B [Aquabacterium lacunae]